MKRLLKSQVYFIMVALIISCSSYVRSNLNPKQNSRGDIYNILHFASLAGSSHNSQPWKVEVFGQDSILVYADLSRKLPVVDKTNRELYISVGAFIENLDIAAKCYGYGTNIHIYEFNGGDNLPVASVLLTKTGGMKNNSDLKEIELRNTLRIPFETKEIKSSDWEQLVSIDRTNIHFIASASQNGKFMADSELNAYTKQAYNKQTQDELANWIRFSNKDVKKKQDGLSTAGMGINGLGGFVVRNFFSPDDSKKESFVVKGIEKTKLLVDNCGGWVVITQKSDNLEACVNTGRLYERLNLKCRKLGLGFHPMSQIFEEQELEAKSENFLGFQGKLMFVARIGYVGNYPAPVSLRRPVEYFTIFR